MFQLHSYTSQLAAKSAQQKLKLWFIKTEKQVSRTRSSYLFSLAIKHCITRWSNQGLF